MICSKVRQQLEKFTCPSLGIRTGLCEICFIMKELGGQMRNSKSLPWEELPRAKTSRLLVEDDGSSLWTGAAHTLGFLKKLSIFFWPSSN